EPKETARKTSSSSDLHSPRTGSSKANPPDPPAPTSSPPAAGPGSPRRPTRATPPAKCREPTTRCPTSESNRWSRPPPAQERPRSPPGEKEKRQDFCSVASEVMLPHHAFQVLLRVTVSLHFSATRRRRLHHFEDPFDALSHVAITNI